ncbi:unnamed protein product, partial [Ectocarpus sp. 12 AP-2014]
MGTPNVRGAVFFSGPSKTCLRGDKGRLVLSFVEPLSPSPGASFESTCTSGNQRLYAQQPLCVFFSYVCVFGSLGYFFRLAWVLYGWVRLRCAVLLFRSGVG